MIKTLRYVQSCIQNFQFSLRYFSLQIWILYKEINTFRMIYVRQIFIEPILRYGKSCFEDPNEWLYIANLRYWLKFAQHRLEPHESLKSENQKCKIASFNIQKWYIMLGTVVCSVPFTGLQCLAPKNRCCHSDVLYTLYGFSVTMLMESKTNDLCKNLSLPSWEDLQLSRSEYDMQDNRCYLNLVVSNDGS